MGTIRWENGHFSARLSISEDDSSRLHSADQRMQRLECRLKGWDFFSTLFSTPELGYSLLTRPMSWRMHFFGAAVVCFLLSEEVLGGLLQADKEPNVMPAENSVWPSVEEQLAAAKVVHGSAVEKLIRENQDFHLLRPEEANDNIGLPVWLRVYWRKKHPEGVYSANDPTGGYPRVLKNLYAWMVLHQDLPSGSAVE